MKNQILQKIEEILKSSPNAFDSVEDFQKFGETAREILGKPIIDVAETLNELHTFFKVVPPTSLYVDGIMRSIKSHVEVAEDLGLEICALYIESSEFSKTENSANITVVLGVFPLDVISIHLMVKDLNFGADISLQTGTTNPVYSQAIQKKLHENLPERKPL